MGNHHFQWVNQPKNGHVQYVTNYQRVNLEGHPGAPCHWPQRLPPNSQFTTTSPTPVALGEEISMECHPHYVAWMLEGVGE